MWRTSSCTPSCPPAEFPQSKFFEYPQSKFGLDNNDDGHALWFRNTHHAGMVRQLMHHSLEAWEDCLLEEEGITINQESERKVCLLKVITRISAPSMIGDPILCPAEPNQFSTVVDKIMVGAIKQMRKFADEAMVEVYTPSESCLLEAALPKNHVQADFRSDLRLNTFNRYENHTNCSGALTSFRVQGRSST